MVVEIDSHMSKLGQGLRRVQKEDDGGKNEHGNEKRPYVDLKR